MKLYTDMVDPSIDPLSPENPLISLTEPLTGTSISTASRYHVVSKSPLTGTIADSSSGGSFGAVLKATGIDGMVVIGRAQHPVWLYVTENGVEFHDASDIWVRLTNETRDHLIAATYKKASVASIGPAGENGVPFAAIMNDNDRAAGRAGMGTVMGAKNLKAIVAYGERKTPVADPEALKAFMKRLLILIDKNPVTGKSLQLLGTSVLVNVINAHGMFPTRNFQRGVFNDAEGISGEKIAETILTKKSACWKCPIACGRVTKTRNDEGEGPEYESVWGFSAQLGASDLEAAARANYACNRLGLDTITTGNTVGCAMELQQIGAWPDGPRWGQVDQLTDWIQDIAYKRGMGANLALGAKKLAEKYGRPDVAMAVKGLELPAYDPRGAQGMALAYATSNRGECHMRAYMIAPKILGQPVFMDRYSTAGKAKLTALFQDISAAANSMALCRFLQFSCGIDALTDMLKLVTGLDFTSNEVVRIGTRTLERWFNQKNGFSRKDDTLPKRLLEEPFTEGASRNRVVKLDEMLNEYYNLRGWDQNGHPTESTLHELLLLQQS